MSLELNYQDLEATLKVREEGVMTALLFSIFQCSRTLCYF